MSTYAIGDRARIVESTNFAGKTGKISYIFSDGRVTVELDEPVNFIRHATVRAEETEEIPHSLT